MSKLDLLCEILGLTQRRIQQLADEGIIPKPEKNGDYDLPACVRQYFEYLYEPTSGDEIDGKQERARKNKAEADRIEFDLKIKKNEYIKTDLIIFELEKVISNCRSKLLSVPKKAAIQVLGLSKPQEIEKVLKDFTYEVLNELMVPDFEQTRDIKDKECGQ